MLCRNGLPGRPFGAVAPGSLTVHPQITGKESHMSEPPSNGIRARRDTIVALASLALWTGPACSSDPRQGHTSNPSNFPELELPQHGLEAIAQGLHAPLSSRAWGSRPGVSVGASTVWLGTVAVKDMGSEAVSAKFVAQRLSRTQDGRLAPSDPPIHADLASQSAIRCHRAVLTGISDMAMGCVLPDSTLWDSVALVPLSPTASELVGDPIVVPGRFDPCAELRLDNGQVAVLAEDESKGSYRAGWLMPNAESLSKPWAEAGMVEIPGPLEACMVRQKSGFVVGSNSKVDDNCGWFTAEVEHGNGPGTATCHAGQRRFHVGIADAGDNRFAVGWTDYAPPKEGPSQLPMGLVVLDAKHHVLWERTLPNSGVHPASGPILVPRHDGSVLAVAIAEHPASLEPLGVSTPVSLLAWRYSGEGVVGPPVPLPDGATVLEEMGDTGQLPPTAHELWDNRVLVAYLSEAGIHWRVLDAAGRTDDDPVCDDGPEGTCSAAEPACELRSCTAQGCVATWADAGMTCGQAGACAEGVCVVP